MTVNALVIVVALLHVWFLVFEMFLWQTPLALKTFGATPEQARDSAVLATNQGVYNGFLAAGLVWSLLASEPTAHELKLFFLGCVLIAGLVGGFTASRKIFLMQALPALLALAAVLLSR